VTQQQFAVSLVPDKPVIMLDEPVYLSFIVRNLTDKNLTVIVGGDYENSQGRPESFSVIAVGTDGKPVAQPDLGTGMGGMSWPQKLPAKRSYTFRLFLPHWATFSKAGKYFITAVRTLSIGKAKAQQADIPVKERTDIPVKAGANILVIPTDSAKMEKIIADSGNKMLGEKDPSVEATQIMMKIQDSRVIPYFLKEIKTRDYEKKFYALEALSRFNDASAFAALKYGMGTRATDIDGDTTAALSEKSADNIRDCAAGALANSPYPAAIPFLLTKRHDRSIGVRNTIIQALEKMKPLEAIPILQEMAHDDNPGVSDEAKRYLKMMQK